MLKYIQELYGFGSLWILDSNKVRLIMESKYKHLYNQLQAQIEKREYKAGDKLPSEGDLMELYGASRDTVRKALDLLVQDGFIRKAKGKPAVVLDKNKFNFPVSEIASFKEIYRFSDSRPKTYVENLEIVKNDPKLMEALQIGPRGRGVCSGAGQGDRGGKDHYR